MFFSNDTLFVDNLEYIRNDQILFSNLEFTLKSGELLHIRGPNGSGKTTLLRCIAGLFKPSCGQIEWNGESIFIDNENYRKELVYIGHKHAIKSDLTAFENLHLSLFNRCSFAPEATEDALRQVGLHEKKNSLAGFLSAGQRQRLALSRLYLATGKVWILDEPFTALDKEGNTLIQEKLVSHLSMGGLIIVTSHQTLTLSRHYQELELK